MASFESIQQLDNILEFVTVLRRYKKSDVVRVGTTLLWEIFQNPNYDSSELKIINSYVPKIILLALATANDHRNIQLNDYQFNKLYNNFFNIRDSISDSSFMDSESRDIIKELSKEDVIPPKYLITEIAREICPIIFISRLLRQQNEAPPQYFNIHEFSILYDVLNRLNKFSNGQAFKDFELIFKIKPLEFIKASFGLLGIANSSSRLGYIKFKELLFDNYIKDEWGVDINDFNLVASKISYNESFLRKNWYENEILLCPQLYQKYYPTPLYKSPIIHLDMNFDKHEISYLIPSPYSYIIGVKNAIFSNMLLNNKYLQEKIGYALEDHIYYALKTIFSDKSISKISTNKKTLTADFLINLPNCILIIECKTNAGAYEALSVMSPKNISNIWSKLYEACKQCSASVKENQDHQKIIIPIILIADHILFEAVPFKKYAWQVGLLNDMNIANIEFISWNYLHYVLSKISLESFENQLIKINQNNVDDRKNMLVFNLRDGIPSHGYEFLQECESQIFNSDMFKKFS